MKKLSSLKFGAKFKFKHGRKIYYFFCYMPRFELVEYQDYDGKTLRTKNVSQLVHYVGKIKMQ